MLQTSIIAVEIASKGTRIELQLRWTDRASLVKLQMQSGHYSTL